VIPLTTPTDLREVMRKTYDEIIDFIVEPKFKAIIDELYRLPANRQPVYVKDVLLNLSELNRRDIEVPKDILIQRSSFGDNRPTLFVVKKYLPAEYQFAWENVNITFDTQPDPNYNEIVYGENAWDKPLPWEVRAALQAMDLTISEVEGL
jgi:hypothetical protein